MKHRFIQLHYQGPLLPPADQPKRVYTHKDTGSVRTYRYEIEPEEIRAIQRDIDSGKYTQLDVAEKYGYSRAVIRRVLRMENIELSIS